MLNPSLTNLLKNGESKYTLVMVTAKRARQIIDGAQPLVETSSSKPVTIALEELLEGKIKYESPTINSVK
jgi:DNA-directed RNA polymerase subunit omega